MKTHPKYLEHPVSSSEFTLRRILNTLYLSKERMHRSQVCWSQTQRPIDQEAQRASSQHGRYVILNIFHRVRIFTTDGKSASSRNFSQATTSRTTRAPTNAARDSWDDLDWHTTSGDDEYRVTMSQQSQVSDTHPPTPSQIATPKPAARKKPSAPKVTSTRTARPLDSESELDLTTVQTPKAKSSSQPRKAVTKSVTPRVVKSKKTAPSRPRLSHFVPAPAATSDIEPEDYPNSADETPKNTGSFTSFDPIVFPAGSYTIQLILDEREVKSTKNRDYMLNGLKKRGVSVMKRSLEIGDMCWVARSNVASGGSPDECVLDYVVERKRLDDLKGSILDGRFHEQKVSHKFIIFFRFEV